MRDCVTLRADRLARACLAGALHGFILLVLGLSPLFAVGGHLLGQV
jgi:hypothetical protein